MKSSLERIDPDSLAADEVTGRETLELHLQRYHFAGRYLKRGNCLDIACGTGYGTFLLATAYTDKIDKIIGVDIDAESIEGAKTKYIHPSIEFACEHAALFKPPVKIHNIVSLETMEHLSEPAVFLKHISNYLEPKGRFIASAPITPSMDANPYHLQDFTEQSFIKLFANAGYRKLDSFVQVQHYQPGKLLGKKEERSKDLRKNLAGYYLTHPSKFFLRIRSLLKDGFSNKYLVVVFEKE